MTLRQELEAVIGLHFKTTSAGLSALVDGPVHLSEADSESMENAIKLREVILLAADTLEAITRKK